VKVLIREDLRNRGVGTEILAHLLQIARRRGLLGFTAEVAKEDESMLHLFEKMDLDVKRKADRGFYVLDMHFKP